MAALAGKVAFITGGARGLGRAHAVRFAAEGADVVVLDLLGRVPGVPYKPANRTDMDETGRLVRARGCGFLGITGDVREQDEVERAVARAEERFGRIDVLVANAGILPSSGEGAQQMSAWHDCLDVMLTGVYLTVRAVVPGMIARGQGGAICIIGSTSSVLGVAYDEATLNPGQVGYGAAKHGALAIMKNFARVLGKHQIRVNTVMPMGVDTAMLNHDGFTSVHDGAPPGWMANAMGVRILEPEEISNAVVWLCSDQARHITGCALPVDAGTLVM
jgi:SDR family mycofactocin-dependent oxidoreductase